jgi:uncharacterized protein
MSAARLAVLLPPSEGKAAGGSRSKWVPEAGAFGGTLGEARRQVAGSLAALGGGDGALLGVGGKHLETAVAANRSLVGGRTLPAWQRYTGVVHGHFDVASLNDGARRQALKSTLVLSGLMGVVRYDDPVPEYRLKMGASLGPLGKLARWWRPQVSPLLNELLAKRFIVDLLPKEHLDAWDASGRIYRVTFVDAAGRSVGHDAKAAKGLLVRHLFASGESPRDALHSFRHDGFTVTVTKV